MIHLKKTTITGNSKFKNPCCGLILRNRFLNYLFNPMTKVNRMAKNKKDNLKSPSPKRDISNKAGGSSGQDAKKQPANDKSSKQTDSPTKVKTTPNEGVVQKKVSESGASSQPGKPKIKKMKKVVRVNPKAGTNSDEIKINEAVSEIGKRIVEKQNIISKENAEGSSEKLKLVQKKRIIKYARPGEQPQQRPPITVSTSAPVKLESTVVKRKLKPAASSPSTNNETVVEEEKSKANPIVTNVKKKKIITGQTSKVKIEKVGHSVIIAALREDEDYSIHHLYQEMKESCVISDRWCIPEPMWDPFTDREVLLCYEVDVLMDGSVRMKRCIKILDTFELIVLLDGADKTDLFREKHPTIKSSQELLDLIRKVTMVKVCSGITHCEASDFENLVVKVNFRGGSWYSSECNVEVERGCLGNICKKCTSLRNTIRRKMRRQFGGDSNNGSQTATPNRSLLSNSLKPVVRSLGEALYSNLHHMTGSNKLEDDDMQVPPVRSTEQVFHPELKVYMNSDLKQRLDEVAANPTPPMTETQIVEYDPRTHTKTIKRIHTPIMPTFKTSLTGGRGSKRVKTAEMVQNQSFVMGNNGELTLVQTPSGETIQLPEGYVLADEGNSWGDNIVVQKLNPSQEEQLIIGEDNSIVMGSNFTLDDGEEYEVIGEAASGEGDAIQVLPLNTNSDIEIIEVDENMIQLVDENSQPEIQPIDSSSDIFKFLQSRLHV